METALADLLACVAAFGRSLHQTFDPRRFLGDFSSHAQRLVPHDRVIINYLEDEGRTFTVFAEDPGRGPALHAGRYTTDFDPGGRYALEDWGLASVFAGDVVLVDDAQRDARTVETAGARARLFEAGIRARVAVPFYAGGRVIGTLAMASFTPGVYTEAHVTACRQIADLIGPFVENVVLLERERRAVHQASGRAQGPFVAVNCAALPETLIESELFRHERGAFTGADKLKRGRFELAAGGTLFLDEIGELAPAVQAKLLRVLQERQFERVGGTATVAADVRLIGHQSRSRGRRRLGPVPRGPLLPPGRVRHPSARLARARRRRAAARRPHRV